MSVSEGSLKVVSQRSVITTGSDGTRTVFLGSNGTADFKAFQQKTGSKNPNWRQQVAMEQDATTAYFRSSVTKLVPVNLSATEVFKSPVAPFTVYDISTTYSGTIGGFLPVTTDDLTLRDVALAKLKRRLRSYAGQYRALVPIAESRDLALTVRGLIKFTRFWLTNLKMVLKGRKLRGVDYRCRKVLIDEHGGRYKDPNCASFQQALSEWWLTYSFGLKPFVNDIANLVQALENRGNDRTELHERFTGKAEKKWLSSEKATTSGSSYSLIQGTKRYEHSLSYRYIAAMDVSSLHTANGYGLSEHLGFGAEQLIPAIWEATTFSWMFDYFLTIGAYLEDTWSIPPGDTKYLVLNKRYSCKVIIDADLATGATPGLIKTGQKVRQGTLEYYNFSRSKLASLPHVGIHFQTTDDITKHSLEKLLNLLSVLRVKWVG